MDRQDISHQAQRVNSPQQAVQSGGAASPLAQAVKHDLRVGDVEKPGPQLMDLPGPSTELDQEGRNFEHIDVLFLAPCKR